MKTIDYAGITAGILADQPEPGLSLSLRHNMAVLRAIHWGAHQVCESSLEFDPRADWWDRAERRFAAAFLADTWPDWPREVSSHPNVERFAIALTTALDDLRSRDLISHVGVDYETGGGLANVLAPIRSLVSELPDHGWSECPVHRKYEGNSASEALLGFLERVERDGFDANEPTLVRSMRWWAVLGARTPEALVERQRFFWSYRLVLCTTNAYTTAGAQYFGPVIGNTKVSLFRDVVRRWWAGESPGQAPMRGFDRSGEELTDRSHTNIARELWGFLNLERAPFYNARVADYLEDDEDPLVGTLRIGAQTLAWLEAHPKEQAALSSALERWLPLAQRSGRQPLAKARRYDRKLDANGSAIDTGAPLDEQLNAELVGAGSKLLLGRFGPRQRAAMMLHLGLDARVRSHASSDSGAPAEPLEGGRLQQARKVWIFAPGARADEFEGDVEHKVARVYWEVDDLTSFETKAELFEALRALRPKNASAPFNDSKTLWAFGHLTRPGDYVVARQGRRMVVGVGRITRDYHYTPDEYGRHRIGVDWFWTGEIELAAGTHFALRTFVDGTSRKALLELIDEQLATHEDEDDEDGGENVAEEKPVKLYKIDNALSELFFTRAEIEKWKRLLERRRNLVLTGPPGVGKTYVAQRLAKLVIGEDNDERIQIVQFHQAYTYEQFVLGYRPAGGTSEGGGSKSQFELAKGPLFRLAEKAIRELDSKFVLIIDEINRGNISRILGEALMLLEADKRSIDWGLELAYAIGDSEFKEFKEGKFFLPPNLYVIGTMNTADRSLAVVDYALRRRFAFVDVSPRIHSEEYKSHARAKGMPASVITRLRERIAELNQRISDDRALGRGFAIGHSFFTINEAPPPWELEDGSKDPEALAHEWLDDVFECELEPLLSEYWAESPAQYEAAKEQLWKGRTRR